MINNYRDPLCFWREWEVRVNSLWPCIPYEHGEEDFKVKEKFNFIETSIFHKHMEIMYSWNRYRAINTGLPKFLFLLLSSLRRKKGNTRVMTDGDPQKTYSTLQDTIASYTWNTGYQNKMMIGDEY